MAMLPVQAPLAQGSVQIRPRRTGGLVRGLAGRSDERLVAIAKEGDERAFEALYERHSPAILRYCRSLLRSTQEAEDVKQEVFALAISALRRGAEPDAFRPWLYRVAHNACMSHLRMRRPVLVADNGVLVGPAAAVEPVEDHREELRQLLDDIGKLPDVQRGALLLREMDGFSYEQVGEVLGLPLSTVRASIFRARRTLQGLAEARDADCDAIQSELCELADRRGRRSRHITTHLNVCSTCRDFRDGLRRRPAVLGGVAPVTPIGPSGLLLALKGKLFGGAAGGGAGGATIATGAGGGAGVAKIVAVAASSVALIAGAGVEADRAIVHSRDSLAATARPSAAGAALGTKLTRDAAAAAAGAPVVPAAGATSATGDAVGRRDRSLATANRRASTADYARAHTRAGRSSVTGTGRDRQSAPSGGDESAYAPTGGTSAGNSGDQERGHEGSDASGDRGSGDGREHHGSDRTGDEGSGGSSGSQAPGGGGEQTGSERSGPSNAPAPSPGSDADASAPRSGSSDAGTSNQSGGSGSGSGSTGAPAHQPSTSSENSGASTPAPSTSSENSGASTPAPPPPPGDSSAPDSPTTGSPAPTDPSGNPEPTSDPAPEPPADPDPQLSDAGLPTTPPLGDLVPLLL